MTYDYSEVRQQFSTCFRGKMPVETRKLSDESHEVEWIDQDPFQTLDMQPTSRTACAGDSHMPLLQLAVAIADLLASLAPN